MFDITLHYITYTAATLYLKPLSTYLSIINQKRKIMSDFDSILKAEGLDLENAVFEISETTVIYNCKTTIGKSKSAPKRSPEELEPEDMEIVEVTTEKSDRTTFSKKATAPKAKPAPKN